MRPYEMVTAILREASCERGPDARRTFLQYDCIFIEIALFGGVPTYPGPTGLGWQTPLPTYPKCGIPTLPYHPKIPNPGKVAKLGGRTRVKG